MAGSSRFPASCNTSRGYSSPDTRPSAYSPAVVSFRDHYSTSRLIMQPAVIIEQSEWEHFTARLAYLEKRDRERDRASSEDTVLTVREVARQLHMSEEAVRRARRERRLTGFKIDEKHYGFRQSEVTRYLNRYNRMAGPSNDPPGSV